MGQRGTTLASRKQSVCCGENRLLPWICAPTVVAGSPQLAGCLRLGDAVRALSESHKRYHGINACFSSTDNLAHPV